MPPKKKSKSKVPEPEPDYEEEEPLVLPQTSTEGEQEDEGTTRCICGSQDEELGMMIQCETCRVWQHGICVGFKSEEECPETYYCEQCRPDLHQNQTPVAKRSSGHQRTASANVMPPPSHDVPLSHKLTASSNNPQLPVNATTTTTATTTSTSHSQTSSRSPSPSTAKILMPKRRNTLNSREAAYEEALERGDVEAMNKITAGEDEDSGALSNTKRKRKRSGGTVTEDSGSSKRKRSSPTPGSSTSDKPNLMELDAAKDDTATSVNGSVKAETAASRRTKRSKKEKELSVDVDDSGSAAPPSSSHGGKKHPNQYTNRGKPSGTGSVSPSKVSAAANRASGSVAPDHQATPTPNTGSRKGGASGQGGSKTNQSSAFAPGSPHQPVNTSWGLPDHLSHLSDLLPTPTQGMIDVPMGNDEISQERGAKVKWPLKRTTIGEMRRRVRAMLDFCTKAQVDVSERAKRAAALEAFLEKASNMGLEGAGITTKGKGRSDAGVDVDLVTSIVSTAGVLDPPAATSPPTSKTTVTAPNTIAMDVSDMSTAELLASLTQDLLNFQERFGAGPGGKVYRETVPRERRPRGAAAAAMAAMERDD